MPILISQLLTRPILLTMAVVNAALLGLCGYLLIVPAGGPALVASVLPASHLSVGTGLIVAVKTTPPHAEPDNSARSSQHDTVVPAHPSLITAARQSMPAEIKSFSPIDPQLGPSQDRTLAYAVAAPAENVSSPDASSSQSVSLTQGTAPSNSFAPADLHVTDSAVSAGISIPLAYTTSAENVSPSQAAALHRLQEDFANNLAAQGNNSNDPAYARAWRSYQTLSDSSFQQQFGTQAFIQAQLAQFHGSDN